MRVSSRAVWLVCAFCFPCLGTASGGEPPTEDEGQVLAADAQLRDALQRGDLETIRQFWTEDYILTTRSGRVLDRSARLKSLRAEELRYLETELDDVETRRRPGVVLVTGRVRSRVVRDGEEGSIGWRRFTMVWVKEEGRWRLLARHASQPTGQ